MNSNSLLFRILLFVVKLAKVHIWFPLRKQEVHLFLLWSWLFLLFWTIGEYSMSYYGRIWRKAHRLLSSEYFGQWVKWSYEVESKFDKERNFAFKIVTLISLLDYRNVVVSLWLSVIIIATVRPSAVMFFHKWFFYASRSSHIPQNSISFDVQIMFAVSGLIDVMTESFSTL